MVQINGVLLTEHCMAYHYVINENHTIILSVKTC